MIVNMAGGSANVQYMNFTLSSIVTGPNQLIIPNVHIPGGVLKGFVLLKDNPGTDEMQNNKIVYAYSNEEMAKTGAVNVDVYLSQYGGLFRYALTNYGYEYNQENQTLMVYPYLGDHFWDVGRYCLFVW